MCYVQTIVATYLTAVKMCAEIERGGGYNSDIEAYITHLLLHTENKNLPAYRIHITLHMPRISIRSCGCYSAEG